MLNAKVRSQIWAGFLEKSRIFPFVLFCVGPYNMDYVVCLAYTGLFMKTII